MASFPINKTFPLNNGGGIPAVGYGAMEKGIAFSPNDRSRIVETLVKAIQAGYRLIDTSKIYGTEEIVGEAVRASGVSRSQLVVVSKLWQTDHGRVQAAFDETMQKLDIGYVDIFLMHWPCAYDGETPLPIEASPTYIETWLAMEKLVGDKCKSIGVSNFTQKTLKDLLSHATIRPVVNQIEITPKNPNTHLVPYCQTQNIHVMAWGPLAGGPTSAYGDEFAAIYRNDVLKRLSEKYHQSIGNLILSWLVTRGITVIPHSANLERITSNLKLSELNNGDVNVINQLVHTLGYKKLIDAATFVWFDDAIKGKGRTIMGWTVQEIGWENEKSDVLV